MLMVNGVGKGVNIGDSEWCWTCVGGGIIVVVLLT